MSPALRTIEGDPGDKPTDHYSASQLLERLISLSAINDFSTAEEIRQIKLALQDMGYDSLRAITNLLRAELHNPANWKDYREQVLLKLLLSLDLPEVEAVALEWLNSNPSSRAVVQLSRYLDSREPGQYNQQIRRATENALLSADLSPEDAGPLFQLLGEFGDLDTVALLQNMPMHQDAYASVALALIPDGSGIPQLEQDARLLELGKYTLQSRIAIELLAQQAYRQPAAAQVIMDLARQNLIPTDIWQHVLALMAGNAELTLDPPAYGRRDTHTIYRPEGDQTIYFVSRSRSDDNFEQSSQRLDLLWELQQLTSPIPGLSG